MAFFKLPGDRKEMTMTPTELLDNYTAAGARYKAALGELEAAFIDLAGHDAAIENRNVPVGPTLVRSFYAIPDSTPWPLRHHVFAPDGGQSWQDASRARGNELINSVKA
ncbi:valine--tRNA ligase [Mesorhizobium australicum]|uniref:Valine--tRNA ligase n=1 Tax=Mesorhizobium australicum TaxID=536018 RepID=A0ACC6SZH5_9HYPH